MGAGADRRGEVTTGAGTEFDADAIGGGNIHAC